MERGGGVPASERGDESQPDDQGRDPSPYVKMSKRKLLMDLIIDDTTSTHEGWL